jgi:hypothetical protein
MKDFFDFRFLSLLTGILSVIVIAAWMAGAAPFVPLSGTLVEDLGSTVKITMLGSAESQEAAIDEFLTYVDKMCLEGWEMTDWLETTKGLHVTCAEE